MVPEDVDRFCTIYFLLLSSLGSILYLDMEPKPN